jgi:transposase, IS5 family
MSQIGLFDVENKLAELSAMGDPLEKLNTAINWNRFKPVIDKAFRKERKSNAGRPPYDYILMFKILVLQSMYNLSDEQTQFQILDRHTFKRFLGLRDEMSIPDQKTIWLFRETLTQQGIVRKLFDMFDRDLIKAGFTAKKGQIVDATFVEAPRQRNTRDENATIKSGDTPDDWEGNLPKLSQKDLDARWTKKNNETHYGYKNHLNVDVKHKLIRDYEVTPADVHDSQVLDRLFDPDNTGKALWADSAYKSEVIDKKLKRRRLKNNINSKGYRNHPLSAFQQVMNKKRSSIRARVEHVNARLDSMIGRWIHCIGRLRAAGKIGLTNLVYNMTRFTYLVNHA